MFHHSFCPHNPYLMGIFPATTSVYALKATSTKYPARAIREEFFAQIASNSIYTPNIANLVAAPSDTDFAVCTVPTLDSPESPSLSCLCGSTTHLFHDL